MFSKRPTDTKIMIEFLKTHCDREFAPISKLGSCKRFEKRFAKAKKSLYRLNFPNKPLATQLKKYLEALEDGRDSIFEEKIAVFDIGKPAGLGAFAKKPFEIGELIGTYSGEIVSAGTSADEGRYAFKALDDEAEYREEMQWLEKYDIDAKHVGSWTTLINGSEDPNIEVVIRYVNDRPLYLLYAIIPIFEGDQLFFCYGPEYWDDLGVPPKELPRHVDHYPKGAIKQLL